MVYIKTYIFTDFYPQYSVLLTMVPRNRGKDILRVELESERGFF